MAEEHTGVTGEDPGSAALIVPRVLLFFDYTCPFCYVDQFRFDRLATEREFETVLVPFELRPEMPPEGYSVSELEAAGLNHGHIEEHLLDIASREGFAMALPGFLPKTHLALALGEMGRDRGHEAHLELHRAIFGAYFAREEDIGSRDVLLAIAQAQGFTSEQVTAVWDEGTYDERLHQFRHVALHLGIAATPAALICNELLIGSRPYRNLQDSLDRCLVTPENAHAVAQEA